MMGMAERQPVMRALSPPMGPARSIEIRVNDPPHSD
jgi:hypothetical protein